MIPCPVPECGKEFKQSGALAVHMSRIHPKVFESIPRRQSRRRRVGRNMKFIDYVKDLAIKLNDKKQFPSKIRL